jgi:predicted membrane-bound dolichyl-phosphate-mannose-protein mannosyltransferase
MSEDSEPFIEERNVQELSHKRINILMVVTAVLGSIASAIFVSPNFGFGVLIGGILSLINFYWLGKSLKSIFDKVVQQGEKPHFIGANYILRYFAFGLALTIIYVTHFVPIVAVLLGLMSFAVAITIEGFIRLLANFSNKKEI